MWTWRKWRTWGIRWKRWKTATRWLKTLFFDQKKSIYDLKHTFFTAFMATVETIITFALGQHDLGWSQDLRTPRDFWTPAQLICLSLIKTNGYIQGGFNEENEPIYIGRAHHEDSYAVGKVALKFVCPIFLFQIVGLKLDVPIVLSLMISNRWS